MSEANSKSFTLKHFLYTGWPDHGVPQHPSSLIQFTKQVRKVYKNSPSPLIVHCRLVHNVYCTMLYRDIYFKNTYYVHTHIS